MPIYKKMAFDKGAADFINKSVSMEELVERLKRVLCNKHIIIKFQILRY